MQSHEVHPPHKTQHDSSSEKTPLDLHAIVKEMQSVMQRQLDKLHESRSHSPLPPPPEQFTTDIVTQVPNCIHNLFAFIVRESTMEEDTGEENPHAQFRISELYSEFDKSLKSVAKQQLSRFCRWVERRQGGKQGAQFSKSQYTANCVEGFNRRVEAQLYTGARTLMEEAFTCQNVDCKRILDAAFMIMTLAHFKTCVIYHSQFDKALENMLLLVLQLLDTPQVLHHYGIDTRPLAQRKLKSVVFCELSIIGFRSQSDSPSKYARLGLEHYEGLAELWNVMAHTTTLKSGTTLAEEKAIAEKALMYHARSIDIYPHSAIYYMNRAILKMGKLYRLYYRLPQIEREALGDQWDPIPDFERSLQINPYNDTALVSRAREYKYRGENARAVEDYKTAVRHCNMQKTYVVASYFLELAELVEAQGDPAAAVRYFTESLRYEDCKPRPYQGRARCLMQIGDYSRAYRDYVHMHRGLKRENRVNTHQQQFQILRALGQHELAFFKVNKLFHEPPLQEGGGKNPYPERFPERALLYARFGERYLAMKDFERMNIFETENGAVYRKQMVPAMAEDHDAILALLG